MRVIRLINIIFTSNTYILSYEQSSDVWIIDPGDCEPIFKWLKENNKSLKGIMITHAHFDHIYGINDLLDKYSGINVFASFYAKEGMMSEKLNGSLYNEMPFVIKRQEVNLIKEGDRILLWEGIFMNVFETPGHNRDCLSFQIEKNLFTGDAFIPGIKVITKMKYGDKTQAANSIKRIFKQFDDDMMIWPGHKNNCFLGGIKPNKIDM